MRSEWFRVVLMLSVLKNFYLSLLSINAYIYYLEAFNSQFINISFSFITMCLICICFTISVNAIVAHALLLNNTFNFLIVLIVVVYIQGMNSVNIFINS